MIYNFNFYYAHTIYSRTKHPQCSWLGSLLCHISYGVIALSPRSVWNWVNYNMIQLIQLPLRNFDLILHNWPSLFSNGSYHPFRKTVSLRCGWHCQMISYSFHNTKLTYLMGKIFSTIVIIQINNLKIKMPFTLLLQNL